MALQRSQWLKLSATAFSTPPIAALQNCLWQLYKTGYARLYKTACGCFTKQPVAVMLKIQMTAEDKSLIYTLLKKTVSFECGYTPSVFQQTAPVFTDDTHSVFSQQAQPVSQVMQTQPVSQTQQENTSLSQNTLGVQATSSIQNTLGVQNTLGAPIVDARMSAALQASALIAQQPMAVSQAQPVSQPMALSQPMAVSQENQENFDTLEGIAAAVKNCRACRLCEQRHNTVFGEGVTNPLVLVVGEGPGADEDKTGRPFVGAAGQLLDKMLAAIDLSRTKNCFIANIVKCRPPNNRTPESDEATICRKYLDAQIKLLKPTMILAMGNTAMQSLLGQSGITKLHGIFFDMHGIPVMPTFHPSALLRDVTKKRDAWEDLKLFRRRLIAFVGQYSQRLS